MNESTMNPTEENRVFPWRVWLETTRPKTLFAALAPVLMGAALARADGVFHFPVLLATLSVAVLIQIGTNFCNDVYDHRQGADTDRREGPRRGLQTGVISHRAMVTATVAVFALAALISLALVRRGGMPIVWLAAASILSGVFYTAGRYSLAYTGLADLFVIVFFGPVAVAGTYYLQLPFGWPPPEVFVVGLGPGLIATSLLAVNNLRDVDEDRGNAKKTLAVRFGRKFSRMEYKACMLLALMLPPAAAALTGRSLLVFALWILFPEARKLFKQVETGTTGKELNPVLGGTGRFLFQYALLFFVTWPNCALCWL
ncbi:MAG: 1,4-dihydroxy-2-naphthoate polyprenyltransferase [Verrucomicrobia bacterium]|nr:1,4-dihydroxy-2-naphthoate polyprenyltransferase [Verrucomicrobiota bacterium]MCH8527660.1 1,4-dihydroxy-2-naphthoate polyprenyltransferase [Kiritimatiellia bacterium]